MSIYRCRIGSGVRVWYSPLRVLWWWQMLRTMSLDEDVQRAALRALAVVCIDPARHPTVVRQVSQLPGAGA